jgi:ribosomal protein S18 acetylase RimI-like enzyme
VIRSCRADEADDVVRVWALADAQPTVTDDARSVGALLTHDPGSLLVADDDGDLVGTLIAAWDGWRGNLYRLAVISTHRRRGIAMRLVRGGETRLRKRGAVRLSAIVAEPDAGAVAFWAAAGYEQQTERLRFVKNLAGA